MSVIDRVRDFFGPDAAAAPEEVVADHRSMVERLLAYVPGLGGYLDRQQRRKTDQLVRAALAQRLATVRVELDQVQKSLMKHGLFDMLTDLGSATTQLQTFIDRVRLASYGYSGLFDAVKINQAQLEHLYNFDLALFGYVERLSTAIGRLRQVIPTGEGIEEVIGIVLEICRETNATFDQRKHLALGSQ